MKKLFLLKSLLLLCALMAGSSSAWAEDEVFYTLDGTITTGGNSNYAQDGGGLTQDGIEWSVTGNTTINPWRIGGKNLTNVDREAYSKTAMESAITKVELELGGITLSSISSIKLIVASDASFNTQLDQIEKTSISANTTLTFNPTSPSTEWATGAYYKFVFNVTAGSSNSYVQLKSAKFYKQAASKVPVINADDVDYAADITSGEIAYTVDNSVDGTDLEATTTTDWISNIVVGDDTVTFDMEENTGAAREGSITLSYDGADDKVVTVTQAAAVAKYAVTFAAPANGTLVIKRDGSAITSGAEIPTGTELTIETTPARGYSLTSWEYKAGDGEWTTGVGATYTVTSAVAFRATFAEITKYNVTLGDDSSTLTEEYGGEGVTLPSRAAAADYTFAGWSATELTSETTTAPTVILAGEYLPASNITLYPVYTRTTGGTATHTVNIGEYAEANDWTVDSGKGQYFSVNIDADVTAAVTPESGNNGKVYANAKDGVTYVQWRLYKDATLTLSATDNITSIKLTNARTSDFSLKYNETSLTNGEAFAVNAKSIDLSVGATTHITDMEIVTDNSIAYYTSNPVTTVDVTITAAKYATYAGARALNFNGVGIKVYTATDEETKVTLNEITSGKVPANTPVVLYKADANGTAISVSVIASADAVGDNDLRVSTGTDVENMYVLAMNPTIGFYPWAGSTDLSAGKVYLQGKASYGARAFIGFDSETTSINEELGMKNEDFATAPVYNLNGQRVAQPTKGLYIVNGRKVVVK